MARKAFGWRERLAGLRAAAVQPVVGGAIAAALLPLYNAVCTGNLDAISAASLMAAASAGGNIIAQQLMEWRRNPQHKEIVERLEVLREDLKTIKLQVEETPAIAPEIARELQTALAWIGDGNVVVMPEAEAGDIMTGGRRADHGGIYQEIHHHHDAESASPPPPPRSPLCTVPPPSAQFVGRKVELDQVEQALTAGRIGAICAVHGLGGVGKSALAFAYAHAQAARYAGGRFLLSCGGVADLRVAVMGLAPLLGLELPAAMQADPARGCACIFAELAARGTALLVFDNAGAEALAHRAALNGLRGHAADAHLLITTREDAGRCGEVGAPIPLDVLPEDDAVALLRAYRPFAGDDEEHARAIARRLGCWTLAVDIVGAYLAAAREVSYADALAWLEEEGIDAVRAAGGEAGGGLHGEVDLTRLLAPTLARLSAAERLALEYAALCPPDAVALPWLRALAGADYPDLLTERKRGRRHPWDHALDTLAGLRLLVPTDEPSVARLHRLVGEALAAGMADDNRTARRAALNAHALERAEFLWEGWVERAHRWEIEPARAYAALLLEAGDDDSPRIANEIVEPLYRLSIYQQMRDLLRHTLRAQEATGLDDPEVAVTCSNLATVERDLGNLAAARELLRRAIAIDEKAFAPDHPTLAIRYSNLAVVERHLGNLDAARELLRRTIAINEKAFASDHPTLAVSYSNLAAVERDLGNPAAARGLLQRAIAIDEAALPAGHPTLAIRYSNLALVEQDLGNLEEARRLLRRAIAIDEKAFAPDHPTLAVDYSNLALVEQDLGNPEAARELLRRAIAIWEKAFAPDHPTLAVSYNNLAYVEQDMGNLEAARELMRRAYRIRLARLEAEHPHTRSSRAWLEEYDPEFAG